MRVTIGVCCISISPHFAWVNCFLINSCRLTSSFAFCMKILSFITNPFSLGKKRSLYFPKENKNLLPITLLFLSTFNSFFFDWLFLCRSFSFVGACRDVLADYLLDLFL